MRPADLLACQADLVHRFDNEDFCEIITGSVSGPYLPSDAFRVGPDGLVEGDGRNVLEVGEGGRLVVGRRRRGAETEDDGA